MPTITSQSPARCAEAIIDRVGKDVRLAIPIGIGKPIQLVDALYEIAQGDSTIKLSIFTGLTLTRPRPKSLLEQRFVGPLLDRVLGTYREPHYVAALRAGTLPSNIAIHEFFLQAGVWTGNPSVQQSYISLSYAHVPQHLERIGTNAFAQLVAPHSAGQRVSLSANTDITLEMMPYIQRRRAEGQPIAVACEIGDQLPYMTGEAEVDLAQFDVCLTPDGPPRDLFCAPKQPVSLSDYAMALHAATLVRDGGTLQIGIGTFGDALSHALILRHRQPAAFREMLDRLGAPLHPDAQLAPFQEGLYGCTEMLVDGYLALMDAGILARQVEAEGGGRSVLDAGFFLGNAAFYRRLRELTDAERALVHMRGIAHTNTLGDNADAKRRARRDARFINTAMAVTVLGAASSDATGGGKVVSGVGGQLDLVTQATRLAGARSIIAVRSMRRQPFDAKSNILWSHGNCTIPRSLRDIFVSEYGVADVRGRSDGDTIAAMIGIADASAQAGLDRDAQRAGKLPKRVAPTLRNTPEAISQALSPYRRSGLLPLFPLGSDMTKTEEALVGPLSDLSTLTASSLVQILAASLRGQPHQPEADLLDRLGLATASSIKERLLRRLVVGAIRAHAEGP